MIQKKKTLDDHQNALKDNFPAYKRKSDALKGK